MKRRTRFGGPQLLAVGIAAALLALLLWPRHVDGPIGWLVQVQGTDAPLTWALEDLGEVAVFAPLGFALSWWTRHPGYAVLAGAALAAVCGMAQHQVAGVPASLLDVALGALAAAGGAVLAVALGRARSSATA
ncbi:hypothetical protein QDR37_03700 [Amnibacterium sp. CER49]|uniref:hypothetical protein n=1 Tax=Amnibacterium sp. CER49 TaxID=3039161 RepID=UPI00244BA317|nr:hypothetical protein [Amnibacterium sp. CER49]MDH2443045.1 hypothetical protein [Amnibacterium sp. CER49]